MTAADLKTLLERIQAWPEEAQEIESELQGNEYLASRKELQIIDAAMASIDGGDFATDAEVKAAFAKFRSG